MPDRSFHQQYEPATVDVAQPRMRGQRRGKQGTQSPVQVVEPQCPTQRITGRTAQQRIERRLWGLRTGPGWL